MACDRVFFATMTRASLVILLFTTALQGQGRLIPRRELIHVLEMSDAWKPQGRLAEYDGSNIDAFSVELAPALRRYGFIGVTAGEWRNDQGGRARGVLFEMPDSAAAYGFFTLRRRTEKPAQDAGTRPAGSESFLAGNRLYFWQSNYVIQIEGASNVVDSLAAALSSQILGRSWKPPVVTHLPPRDLVPGTEQYVLSAEDLDPGLGLNATRLGFGDSVEAASASYRKGGGTSKLTLLMYPTPQVAQKYSEELDSRGITSFHKRTGPLVAIVSGSDEESARAILEEVNHEYKVTWNESRLDLNIADVLLTIFTFIGIALSATLVAGLGFGGLRLFVKARYPDRVFDRSEDIEIIQLKLNQGLITKKLAE